MGDTHRTFDGKTSICGKIKQYDRSKLNDDSEYLTFDVSCITCEQCNSNPNKSSGLEKLKEIVLNLK